MRAIRPTRSGCRRSMPARPWQARTNPAAQAASGPRSATGSRGSPQPGVVRVRPRVSGVRPVKQPHANGFTASVRNGLRAGRGEAVLRASRGPARRRCGRPGRWPGKSFLRIAPWLLVTLVRRPRPAGAVPRGSPQGRTPGGRASASRPTKATSRALTPATSPRATVMSLARCPPGLAGRRRDIGSISFARGCRSARVGGDHQVRQSQRAAAGVLGDRDAYR
jgi:hypothetical protein